ncbi:T9SS C-terminal target domain-containing protein, partial|uniref:hypothetical protein n=1 Tax=Escherichia coli TaxID=562 RepID=UPI00169268E6
MFVLLLGFSGAGATHIQGGYIRVTPVAGQALTYTITALIYTEPTLPASRDMNSIPICLGDGTSRIVNQKSQSVIGTGGRLAASVYETTYTYAGAGTYRITVSLANRSVLLNGPADADQALFTVATTFTISNTGSNNTPLPVAPETNFVVTVNQRATLSLRAIDPEGDSLVYRLATPMTAANATPCSGSTLSRYSYPNDVARQGTFTLNGRTGELIWFAPVREGRYNVAIY